MTTRQKDYAHEVKTLIDRLRKVSTAHDVSLDMILHDLDIALCDDENYTNEEYLGIYKSITPKTQPRLSIPSAITPSEAYHVYFTEWKELHYRPVIQQRRKQSPIIEA